jgi:hypothetical protein
MKLPIGREGTILSLTKEVYRMKAKMLLMSVIAGLALFAASAGIASADDPHKHNDHHGDHHGDRHDDHGDKDRDHLQVAYCWNFLTCDFSHGDVIIVFVVVPYGYYPGMTPGAMPLYMYGGYPGAFPWMPAPGMGY